MRVMGNRVKLIRQLANGVQMTGQRTCSHNVLFNRWKSISSLRHLTTASASAEATEDSETVTVEFSNELYIPLTSFQKVVLAVGTGLSSFFDPTRAGIPYS